MKSKSNPFLRTASLTASIVLSLGASASAADYQWNGTTDSTWSTPGNWSPAGTFYARTIVAGPAPTGASFAHRLNVLNGANSALIYDGSLGTTVYANSASGQRGLVMSSGSSAPASSFTITGGSFSTLGSNAADVIGNSTTSGTTSVLTVNGGTFIGNGAGTILNFGGTGNVSTLNIDLGTATLTTLTVSNGGSGSGTVNLNGGTLAANQISKASTGTATFNFNGGTLKARTANATFFSDFATTTANVKSGGAVIDTSGDSGTGVNVTIGEALVEDPASTGGDLTKNGAGTLTLGEVSTISGDVIVNAGGLGVKAGATSWTPSTFTHSGDTLNFDLGVYDAGNPALIDVATLTLNTTDITVNISGSSIPIASEIKILEYGGSPGPGSLKLNIASLPTNMVAELKENTLDGYYYLEVTSPSATAFTWAGDTNPDGTGNWDIATSLNWNTNTVAYAQPALVTFPDIAAGGTVTITTDVAPLTLDINNAVANNYTFAGTGKITGTTGITKAGTGIATFDGAAHTYSGTLAINTGAVIKNVADATSGNINVATNAALGLTGDITDGSGQTLSLSGPGLTVVNGVFAAVQRGALQSVSGNNTWAGNISIPVAATGLRIGTQNDAKLTLNGNITEAVPGCAVIFRLGNTVGSDITVNGTTNNWTGDTQVFGGGKLILGTDNALPAASRLLVGTSNVNANTYLDLNGNDQTSAGLNRVNYSTTDLAFITNDGATASVLTLQPATDQSWLGVIQDGVNPISLVISGTASQGLALSSTYTGTTTVESGRLEIQENQSATGDVIINGGSLKLSYVRTLASGVNMSIASGAFFYPDGSSQTLGKLEGSGTIDFTYTAGGVDTLTVGAGDATSTFDGVIQQSTARTHALTKIGTGTFTLTGANTYTGDTTVDDGTLSVAQSNFADTSTVTIGTAAASPAVLHLPNVGTDIVASLVIDGVAQPGNGLVYDSSNSDGAITGSGKIQVGVAGYTAWATDNSVAEGENGDDDDDGIINLVEYALGLDPQVNSNPAGTFTGNTLTYNKGTEANTADDVTYIIETSTSLQTGSWTNAAVADPEDSSISYTLPSGAGKLFARLKVTKP